MNDSDLQSSSTPSDTAPKTVLGASLRADYEALQNDLEQATELAADFQRQLAGKSNEVAHFKGLVERMQIDLTRLDTHLQELRQERHRLANEAMRAAAMDVEVKRQRREIERLQQEVETLRSCGVNRVEQLQIVNQEQQREITRLRAAVDVLRKQDKGAGGLPTSTPAPVSLPTSTADPGTMQRQISDLTALVHRLQSSLNDQARADRRRTPGSAVGGNHIEPDDSESDVINISFGS